MKWQAVVLLTTDLLEAGKNEGGSVGAARKQRVVVIQGVRDEVTSTRALVLHGSRAAVAFNTYK
jgi:hypothetical protein